MIGLKESILSQDFDKSIEDSALKVTGDCYGVNDISYMGEGKLVDFINIDKLTKDNKRDKLHNKYKSKNTKNLSYKYNDEDGILEHHCYIELAVRILSLPVLGFEKNLEKCLEEYGTCPVKFDSSFTFKNTGQYALEFEISPKDIKAKDSLAIYLSKKPENIGMYK